MDYYHHWVENKYLDEIKSKYFIDDTLLMMKFWKVLSDTLKIKTIWVFNDFLKSEINIIDNNYDIEYYKSWSIDEIENLYTNRDYIRSIFIPFSWTNILQNRNDLFWSNKYKYRKYFYIWNKNTPIISAIGISIKDIPVIEIIWTHFLLNNRWYITKLIELVCEDLSKQYNEIKITWFTDHWNLSKLKDKFLFFWAKYNINFIFN